mmetsp:Transcript_25290/g.36682  ORF Transcript_25290/g.36682 Transcript_25290/m.36682 type:complete len:454 (-) Transcript_25290:546-1907(-)
MGNFASRIASLCTQQKSMNITMLGLDAAGKTTILYRMAGTGNEVTTTIPTIGFNLETLKIKGSIFTVWDVGGRDKIRPLARHFYRSTDAIIFVLDSNDHERFDAAKDELHRALNEEELKGKPVLVFCNKQDLPNSSSPEKVVAHLDLPTLSTRKWIAMGSVANSSVGLYEGLDWLSRAHFASEQESTSNSSSLDLKNPKKLEVSESSKDEVELGYEPTEDEGNSTLRQFSVIKNGTECPFAKSAKLWGGKPVPKGMNSIEEQAKANIQPLTEFLKMSNEGKKLDGFCIEIFGHDVSKGCPKELGECVRRYLTALSEDDPAGESMMHVNYIGSKGWRFRFGNTDFFVTTFAPCYPVTSSRYAFGASSAFILLQPEESFARRDLPFDTSFTNWETPKTVRDKTRVAFRAAGRGYHIPETTHYPPAEHIVKPLRDDGNDKIKWWQGIDTEEKKTSN